MKHIKLLYLLVLGIIITFCPICVTAQALPSNDECSGAISLPVNTGNSCPNVYSGNIGYSTQSLPSCAASGYDAKDVWFKFTAAATTHRITLTPVTSDNYVFQVYSGTCGSLTSLACVNTGASTEPDVIVLNSLTIGNTYYLRLYDYYGGGSVSQTFSICINTATTLIDNDNCSGALNVIPSVNISGGAIVTSNNTGATQSLPGCYGSAEDDVWFKFTAVATRQRITVGTNNDINPVLEVFTGTCSALSSLTCRYTPTGNYSYIDADLTSLTIGNTYYYRIYGSSSNNVRTNIGTSITTPPAPPSNDECSGAISLPVNTGNSCPNVYSGNIGYSTQSLPSCAASGYDAKDVWFKFTAAATTHRITLTPVTSDNYVFQVYSGTCGSLTSLACVNTGASTEPDVIVLNSLTIGNTYYLRLYDYYGGGSVSQTFSICINTATTLIDNDNCSGALNVIPSVNISGGAIVTSNNTGATQSLPGCYGSAEDDVWFKFTAVATRQRITVGTNNDINPVLEVFTGTCSALSSLTCRYTPTGNYSYIDADLTSLTIGNTYYYRIYGSSSNNVRTNIGTSITTPPAPPSNDECSGAISLPVNTGNSCPNVYSGNIGYSTQSLPSCAASGYDAKDVWFKFTAAATTHRITLTPVTSDNYVFQVYSGTCGSLTSLACVNTGASTEPDVIVLNSLTIGNTYYLRLYDYYGGGSVSQTFSICINTATTLIDNDNCSGALNVIPSVNISGGAIVTSNNTGATQSLPGCYGSAEDDVWFKFTAVATRQRITVGTNNDINPVLEVFTGTCSALSSLTCRYTPTGNYSYIDADLTSLTIGNTYYYRVYGSSSNNVRTNIGTSINTLPALPVTLSAFTVRSEKINNILSWQTRTETNSKGFVVELSNNGRDFDSLGFIASKAITGNSLQQLDYVYTHNTSFLPGGKIYYRLKQIDMDGAIRYSNVVVTNTVSNGISIYPNPVKDYVYFKLPLSDEYNYMLMDNIGRIFKKGVLRNKLLYVADLKPGLYFIQLQYNDLITVSKLFKE